MKFRRESMEALADDAAAGRLAALISRKLGGDPPLPEPAARILARHTMAVARSYGLETERDIGIFALDMISINPEFHKQPHIHRILRDGAIEAPERLARLLAEVSREEWNAAARMTPIAAYWTRVLREGGMAGERTLERK